MAGRTVDIVEAQNAHLSTQESKFKQSGLSVTLTNPIITAVQTAQQMKKSADGASLIYDTPGTQDIDADDAEGR